MCGKNYAIVADFKIHNNMLDSEQNTRLSQNDNFIIYFASPLFIKQLKSFAFGITTPLTSKITFNQRNVQVCVPLRQSKLAFDIEVKNFGFMFHIDFETIQCFWRVILVISELILCM